MNEYYKIRNFENVKVGDPVIYHTRFGAHLTKVTRVTKVAFAIECCGDQLFRKDNGDRRGAGAWDFSHCTIATEETVAEVENEKKKKDLRIQVTNKIQRLNVKSLSIEQLEELGSVLDKFIGE